MKLRRPTNKECAKIFVLAIIVEILVFVVSKIQGVWIPDGRICIGLIVLAIPAAWDTTVLMIEDMKKAFERDEG